ncbi:hypothetical protein GJ496_003451 [Pomphorhynchus laevis]|nr:hypothetical protein GJ496_003450 [Pomphorhynchus laevis]KAI0983346.1 hypothetical protein GJ496_003451 [Pomphorhynchus laevis]
MSGLVAKDTETCRYRKYVDMDSRQHLFTSIAVETIGAVDPDSHDFMRQLGSRLARVSGDERALSFVVQRISTAIQRGNAS